MEVALLLNFSELTGKLESAQSLTKECLQICQQLFIDDRTDQQENADQWFDNVRFIYKQHKISISWAPIKTTKSLNIFILVA